MSIFNSTKVNLYINVRNFKILYSNDKVYLVIDNLEYSQKHTDFIIFAKIKKQNEQLRLEIKQQKSSRKCISRKIDS